MSKGIITTIAGGLEIAVGVALEFVPGFEGIGTLLIISGAGMVLSGVGTMLQKGPLAGVGAATRNPIAPWTVVYGRARVGGTIIYINTFGDQFRYLDMVIAVACHPCQAVDELLFDQQRIQIGAHNSSFTPVQEKIPIVSVNRTNNLVTVILNRDIPLLSPGDPIIIEGVTTDRTFNGTFPVMDILSRVGPVITFTYLCGGGAITITGQGDARTNWADFGRKVYMETMLGTQTLGTTFTGMVSGTPNDGNTGDIVQPIPNPWTANCSLVGHTAVFLRLHWDDGIFANGIPQIAFHVSGKNDIRDDRHSPPVFAYTENAALIIADYLAQPVWGFKMLYGSEIPITPLIAAANICDESVALAIPPTGTEARYALNGTFQLTTKRGEVLQNLLTACGGRITVTGGQAIIYPAAWHGTDFTVTNLQFLSQCLPSGFLWRPTVSISGLFNGVKGTYVSAANNWQSSDFPRYAQDVIHGYGSDANLADDGGERRWLDIQLPFTISSATAQRLAKIELLRRRYQGTGTFTFNMSGYIYAPLDVLAITLTYFGWAGKLLEITATRFRMEQQQSGEVPTPVLGVEVDVQETDSSIYAWNVGEELSSAGYQQVITQDNKTPASPTNLRLTNGSPVLTWTAPNDHYVINGGHIEGRYMVVASPPGLWISLGNISPSITTLNLSGLTTGNNYIIQLRSVNAAGVPSPWVGINAVGPPVHQWGPYQTQAPVDDALFPSEYTFDLSQIYTSTSGTDWTVAAISTGKQPVNQFIRHCPQVAITAQNISVLSTGGLLPGGVTLYLSISAVDATNAVAPPSTVVAVSIPSGTNTNSVQIGDAAAMLTGEFSTTNAFDGQQVNISDKIYTFQTTLTNVDGNVHIGADMIASLANLVNAINLGPGSGSAYAAATTLHSTVSATSVSDVITCTAKTAGPSGNGLTASGMAAWQNLGIFYGGATFVWPAIPGFTHYVVFASLDYDLVCAQQTGVLTPTGVGSTYTPTSITFGATALVRSTWSIPIDTTALVRMKACSLIHGGVQGGAVDAITSTTILISQSFDIAGTDDWTGRKLAIIGRNNATAPYVSFDVTAFNPSTGLFTVTQNPITAGVQVGDAVVVCTKGVDNSGNQYVVTDSGLSNSQDLPTPHAGLIVNDPVLQGAVLRVIAGTSRGQSAHIVSNDATSLTLDSPIPIDSTSIWIIIGSTWPYTADSDSTNNGNYLLPVQISTQVGNAVGTSLLLTGLSVDNLGDEAQDADAPIRMLFVYGAGMSEVLVNSAGSPPVTTYQMIATDQVVVVDASAAPVLIILPPQSVVRRTARYIKKIDATSNAVTIVGYGSPPETIDGTSGMSITTQWDAVTLLPNS